MLLRHSGLYVLGRGVPALINLAGVYFFTRLLSPEQYGRYALVFSGALFVSSVVFNWLQMGLLRFLPLYHDAKDRLLSTVAVCFFALVVVTGVAGSMTALCWPDRELRLLIVLGTAFFMLHSWLEMVLQMVRSQLAPVRYGAISTLKAAIALVVGGLLAYAGAGPAGLFLGLILGNLLPSLFLFKKDWSCIRVRLADRAVLRQLLQYGLPLTVSFALSSALGSLDRFMIGGVMGLEAAGLYSVAYDLPRQSLLVLMMTVNLAAFPLAVRAFEQEGNAAAREQMVQNATLLMAVSIPAAVGFALLAPNISQFLLGRQYQVVAVTLMPLIVLGTFLSGLRMYYFDQSFYLGKSTISQVWLGLISVVLNFLLNYMLIPQYGLIGAAYANIITGILSLILSWALGRRIFYLPLPLNEVHKVILATCGMAAALSQLLSFQGKMALLLQLFAGCTVYLFLLLLTDGLHSRQLVLRKFRLNWSK